MDISVLIHSHITANQYGDLAQGLDDGTAVWQNYAANGRGIGGQKRCPLLRGKKCQQKN